MSLFTDPAFSILAADTPTGGFGVIWDFLSTGGFVMLLIVLCSMAAVTVIITACLQLRDSLVLPGAVITQLKSVASYAAKGDITPLQDFLDRDPSVLARLGALAISGEFQSRQECLEAVTSRAKEEMLILERGVPLLEVLVTVAPLLGLLGTTVGLVGMFTVYGAGGEGGPDTAGVAKEIGVALRCTIAGLFVAVPSVIAHTYFVRRLDGIGVRLECLLQETIQAFYAHFEVQRAPNS